jgi:hypothetical protein
MIGDCSPNVLLNLIGIQTKIADNSLLFDLHDYIYRKRYLETLGFLSLTQPMRYVLSAPQTTLLLALSPPALLAVAA